MSGTNDGADPQHGLPATGHRFEIPGVTIGRMRDGKIAENKDYYNLAGYLMQVGLMPSPQSASAAGTCAGPEAVRPAGGRSAAPVPGGRRRPCCTLTRTSERGRVTSAVTVSRALTWDYASEHSRDSSALLAVPCPRCARGAEPAGGGRTCGGFRHVAPSGLIEPSWLKGRRTNVLATFRRAACRPRVTGPGDVDAGDRRSIRPLRAVPLRSPAPFSRGCRRRQGP